MARVTLCESCGKAMINESASRCHACSDTMIAEIGRRFALAAQIEPGESATICPCCRDALVKPSCAEQNAVINFNNNKKYKSHCFLVNVFYECPACKASWADELECYPGYLWIGGWRKNR